MTARYKIFIRRSVRKDLASLPQKDLKRIIQGIQSLSSNPRPRGCKKLSEQERYRIRQGRYRIIYSIQDRDLTVWVVKVGHRREVYR
ncbi:MAG: type II toxin-antitoxin system RelE/ParE family toxin [PVC group bacterium]